MLVTARLARSRSRHSTHPKMKLPNAQMLILKEHCPKVLSSQSSMLPTDGMLHDTVLTVSENRRSSGRVTF